MASSNFASVPRNVLCTPALGKFAPLVYPVHVASRIDERAGSIGGMILTGEDRSAARETRPGATLFTTNPTQTAPESNPGLLCTW